MHYVNMSNLILKNKQAIYSNVLCTNELSAIVYIIRAIQNININ